MDRIHEIRVDTRNGQSEYLHYITAHSSRKTILLGKRDKSFLK